METVTKKKNGEAVSIKVSKRKRNIGVSKMKRWVTGNYSQVEARLCAYFNTPPCTEKRVLHAILRAARIRWC